jgi:HTH-type transcriptional regulator/antitoxin HipB
MRDRLVSRERPMVSHLSRAVLMVHLAGDGSCWRLTVSANADTLQYVSDDRHRLACHPWLTLVVMSAGVDSSVEASMRISSPHELGLRIRDRRRELGLSQAELGKTLGVTRQWVIALEQGKPTVPLGHVLRALSALGLVADIREPHAGATVSTDDEAPSALRRLRVADAQTLEGILRQARASRTSASERSEARRSPDRSPIPLEKPAATAAGVRQSRKPRGNRA